MNFKLLPGVLLVALASAQTTTAMNLALRTIARLKSPTPLVRHFSKVSYNTELCPRNNKNPPYRGHPKVKNPSICERCCFKDSSCIECETPCPFDNTEASGYGFHPGQAKEALSKCENCDKKKKFDLEEQSRKDEYDRFMNDPKNEAYF